MINASLEKLSLMRISEMVILYTLSVPRVFTGKVASSLTLTSAGIVLKRSESLERMQSGEMRILRAAALLDAARSQAQLTLRKEYCKK